MTNGDLKDLVLRLTDKGHRHNDVDMIMAAATLHGLLVHGGELVTVNQTLCDLLEAACEVIERSLPEDTMVDDSITVRSFVAGVRTMMQEHKDTHKGLIS